MAQTERPVQLKPRTLEAFDAYIRHVEMEMEPTLRARGPFLWSEVKPERAQDSQGEKDSHYSFLHNECPCLNLSFASRAHSPQRGVVLNWRELLFDEAKILTLWDCRPFYAPKGREND
jgi:hypothetical protein